MKKNSHLKYVILPCFIDQIKLKEKNLNAKITRKILSDKWKRVVEVFQTPIESFDQLKNCLNFIHSDTEREHSVETFEKVCGKKKKKLFKCLNVLKKCVLDMPTLFNPDSIPYLINRRKSEEQKICLTKEQVRCIMAGGFFGIMIDGQLAQEIWSFETNHGFPAFDLRDLLFYNFQQRESCFGMFQCLLHYFETISTKKSLDLQKMTIVRKTLRKKNFPIWSKSQKKLTKVKILKDGYIEQSLGHLQVDFANEYIGGGVLHGGCLQEEILFVIKPECLISLMCCSVMNKRESILIYGAEQFSKYKGYGWNFSFDGYFNDSNPIDKSDGHLQNQIVAIDAVMGEDDYLECTMKREVEKAYSGFSKWSIGTLLPVATGNWGCGAFGGDKRMKCLIQWIAATESSRDVLYHEFDKDKTFINDFERVYKTLISSEVTVGKLWNLLVSFEGDNLFSYLENNI